jgi:PucR family transcriptional regulator, purine catabolism regulatory protein
MTRVANDRPVADPDLPTADVPGSRPGLPLAEVMALPVLCGSQLIAGAGGRHRPVTRVNVMEVPDVLPYVRDGELLVTTGYAVRDDPARLASLVRELHQRGVAALGIKLGRYVDELPPAVAAVADELGFPVVRLADTTGYDELLAGVLTAVLDHQAERLRRSQEVHRALLQVVLQGGGLPEVASALAGILDVSVHVRSTTGAVLAEAGVRPPCDPADADRPRDPDADPACAVVRVVAGSVDLGSVVASAADRPLGDVDVLALQHAATVCALVLARQQAVAAVDGRYRADFLRDVLLNRAGGPERTVPHAAGLGWDLDRRLLVVVVEPDAVPVDRSATRRAAVPGRPEIERLAAAWTSAVRARDAGGAVAGFSTEVVAVLGCPVDGPDDDAERRVHDLVAAVRAELPRPSSLGISRPADGVRGLAAAYEQARKALRVGRQVHGGGAVTSFDRLGVHRLLSLVPDPAELRAFERETLRELAADTAEAADLRQTLQVLLDTNLNVAQAARALHFHYNTLRYRITKLERALGPFTSDPLLRLDLALALRVVQMRGIDR